MRERRRGQKACVCVCMWLCWAWVIENYSTRPICDVDVDAGSRSQRRSRRAVITHTKSRSLTFSHVTHATLERLRRVPVRTDAAVPMVLLDYFRLALLSSHGRWFFVHNIKSKALSKGDVKCSWPKFCNCCCCCCCCAAYGCCCCCGAALVPAVTAASFPLMSMHTFSFCTPFNVQLACDNCFFLVKNLCKIFSGQIENCCGVAVCDARINTKCCWTIRYVYIDISHAALVPAYR